MPLPTTAVPAADAATAPFPSLVACLCAQWCNVCQQYRAPFEALARDWPQARWLWVDIEDEEEMLGDLEVQTFPTLLIAGDDGVRFLGPLPPQVEQLTHLLPRLAKAPRLADPALQALWQRICAHTNRA